MDVLLYVCRDLEAVMGHLEELLREVVDRKFLDEKVAQELVKNVHAAHSMMNTNNYSSAAKGVEELVAARETLVQAVQYKELDLHAQPDYEEVEGFLSPVRTEIQYWGMLTYIVFT